MTEILTAAHPDLPSNPEEDGPGLTRTSSSLLLANPDVPYGRNEPSNWGHVSYTTKIAMVPIRPYTRYHYYSNASKKGHQGSGSRIWTQATSGGAATAPPPQARTTEAVCRQNLVVPGYIFSPCIHIYTYNIHICIYICMFTCVVCSIVSLSLSLSIYLSIHPMYLSFLSIYPSYLSILPIYGSFLSMDPISLCISQA